MRPRKIALYAMFLAIAIIVGYLERMLPSPVPLPGIKLGLSNAIVLMLLYLSGARAAALVNGLRIAMTGLLFTGVTGFMFAAGGAVLSFAGMLLAKESRLFGIIGVSVFGAVLHNVGQITVAVLLLGTPMLYSYLAVLVYSGVICGIVVGLAAGQLVNNVHLAIDN